MTKNKSNSLIKISFFQALGLGAYCGLVGLVMSNAEHWFQKIPEYFAPLIMLLLLTTSALICGLITLSYPINLFIQEKQINNALRLVFYTILWLILFLSLIVGANLIFRF
jgi:hypothetical protein